MKTRLLRIVFMALMPLTTLLAVASDVVILKNGNVVRGNILSRTETVVTIKADNGRVLEYPMIEVQKISDSKEVSVPAKPVSVSAGSYYTDYTELNTGFWCAAELGEAVSVNLSRRNYTFTELDFVGGYRMSEFLRFGLGLGARFYNDNSSRYSKVAWGMPIYATVRGNVIPGKYRDVVPYYSFDMGGSVRDGFMIRPGLGIRIGQKRSAFLINLSYLGQNIISRENDVRKNKFTSFFMLKIGYEF